MLYFSSCQQISKLNPVLLSVASCPRPCWYLSSGSKLYATTVTNVAM